MFFFLQIQCIFKKLHIKNSECKYKEIFQIVVSEFELK